MTRQERRDLPSAAKVAEVQHAIATIQEYLDNREHDADCTWTRGGAYLLPHTECNCGKSAAEGALARIEDAIVLVDVLRAYGVALDLSDAVRSLLAEIDQRKEE